MLLLITGGVHCAGTHAGGVPTTCKAHVCTSIMEAMRAVTHPEGLLQKDQASDCSTITILQLQPVPASPPVEPSW